MDGYVTEDILENDPPEAAAEGAEAEAGQEVAGPEDEGARLRAAVEAMLFATGKALSFSEMAKALETGEGRVKETAEELAAEYEERKSGIRIIFLGDSCQMSTAHECYDTLIKLVCRPKKPNLTEVLMETLSIIAYRQPVTKGEIERIRGVNSDHAVNRLVEYGLVQEIGRAMLPGRPILFGTTHEFMRQFGVSSQDDLPDINPVAMADLRAQAEEEAKVEVDV